MANVLLTRLLALLSVKEPGCSALTDGTCLQEEPWRELVIESPGDGNRAISSVSHIARRTEVYEAPLLRCLACEEEYAAASLGMMEVALSGGRANLHQGAIGAGIDLDTGITCRAVLRKRVTTTQPDMGESVVGFQVPYWPQILDLTRRVSKAVGLGYLGVDVVLDKKEGPLLLEANARPGLAIQIANGLGLLPRLREVERQLQEGCKLRLGEEERS